MSSSTSANLRTHSLIFCMLCCPEKWGNQPRPLAAGGLSMIEMDNHPSTWKLWVVAIKRSDGAFGGKP